MFISKANYNKLSKSQRDALSRTPGGLNIIVLTRAQVDWLTAPDPILQKMRETGRTNMEKYKAKHGTLIGALAHRRRVTNR